MYTLDKNGHKVPFRMPTRLDRIKGWFRMTFHRCTGPVIWRGTGRANVGNAFLGYSPRTTVELTVCKCKVCGRPFGSFETGAGSHPMDNVGYYIRRIATELPTAGMAFREAGLI